VILHTALVILHTARAILRAAWAILHAALVWDSTDPASIGIAVRQCPATIAIYVSSPIVDSSPMVLE